MNRIELEEKQIAHAKERFAHHKADFRQLDGISMLNWQHESGSTAYYVRYVFDEKRGLLYISGDLGHAVVELTEAATLKALSRYIYMVGYFVEKIKCSTDLYSYDEKLARSDLESRLSEYEEEHENDEEEENIFDEKMSVPEIISDLLSSLDVMRGLELTEEQQEYLSEIDPDYWEWIGSVGQYICTRVILWLVGLNMAYQQIRKENENGSNY